MLTTLVPKYGRKFWHPWERPYLPGDVHMLPLIGDPKWDYGDEEEWGITVDGEPVYPATPHLRCVAVGICHSLFRGSLTLMNIASFMVLVMPWDSLPTMEKLSNLME